MPLNRAMIGESHKSDNILEITAGNLNDAVTQFEEPHPMYQDVDRARSAGYPGRIAPPAFGCRLWFRALWGWPMNEPDLGRKPGANLLLGEINTVMHRPITVGDRLAVTATVADIVEIRGARDLMHIDVDIASVEGEAICRIGYKFVIAYTDTFGEN